MKRTSAAMLTHMGSRSPFTQTLSRCARVQRRDGQIFRFTDHDSDIVISGWAAPDAALNGTYETKTGLGSTDIISSAGMNVDNMEIVTPQTLIEAVSLHAGLWDYARVVIFLVNWADLSMGPHYLRVGHIGELSTQVLSSRSEVRGLLQAYSQTLGVLTSPTCRNDFGDSSCGVDLTPYTKTGTLTGVNPDNRTLYDTARTEPGPAYGISVTNISNANPGIVTMLNGGLNLKDGQAISISGVVGMERLNQVTIARYPTGNTFKLSLDTTDTDVYGTYASGGIVTALGASRGYFEGGKLLFTSGQNSGLYEDVQYYVPGQIILALPMPFPINQSLDSPFTLDSYVVVKGCGKQFLTNCIGEYNNGVNFNGEPWIAGIDKLIQVGRRV